MILYKWVNVNVWLVVLFNILISININFKIMIMCVVNLNSEMWDIVNNFII